MFSILWFLQCSILHDLFCVVLQCSIMHDLFCVFLQCSIMHDLFCVVFTVQHYAKFVLSGFYSAALCMICFLWFLQCINLACFLLCGFYSAALCIFSVVWILLCSIMHIFYILCVFTVQKFCMFSVCAYRLSKTTLCANISAQQSGWSLLLSLYQTKNPDQAHWTKQQHVVLYK